MLSRVRHAQTYILWVVLAGLMFVGLLVNVGISWLVSWLDARKVERAHSQGQVRPPPNSM